MNKPNVILLGQIEIPEPVYRQLQQQVQLYRVREAEQVIEISLQLPVALLWIGKEVSQADEHKLRVLNGQLNLDIEILNEQEHNASTLLQVLQQLTKESHNKYRFHDGLIDVHQLDIKIA